MVMAYRILHCGKSIENYNLCIEHKIAGFTKRGKEIGDIIYLAVRVKKKSLCGLRAKLSDTTDIRPWEDADNYVSCFMMEDIEYCKPFEIKVLAKVGGQHWNLKYLQGSKAIEDEEAIKLLDETFNENKTDKPTYIEPIKKLPIKTPSDHPEELPAEASDEPPEEPITIMGTFQTIKFKNETDEFRGLEKLVNDNFYNCFPDYSKNRTVLIPENRIFISSGVEVRGDEQIRGIKSIPDALLILFNKQYKSPFQINLIEYECFGETKTKAQDKSNYLNGQIIPQLMRFASAFSIVTDKQIRDQTIKNWSEKIISYLFSNDELKDKVTNWVKDLEPDVSEGLIGLKIHNYLENAFKSSLRIILIIDELSSEQKQTISNVVEAFKLDNGESTRFLAYIIRLEQKINIVEETAEFALSVQ
jgi:hypothetical protein